MRILAAMYAHFILIRRKEKGYRQSDMAKIMKVSTRTYKRMEAGNITLNQLADIGKVLGFSVQIVPDECKLITV